MSLFTNKAVPVSAAVEARIISGSLRITFISILPGRGWAAFELAKDGRGRRALRSHEAWVRFVSDAKGPVWPGAAEMEVAAEKLSAQPVTRKGESFPVWKQLVTAWVKRDIAGATTWLQAQAGKSHHDIAVAAFVNAVRPIDPKVAKQWEDTIRDPEVKSLLSVP